MIETCQKCKTPSDRLSPVKVKGFEGNVCAGCVENLVPKKAKKSRAAGKKSTGRKTSGASKGKGKPKKKK